MREIKFRGLRTDGRGWAYGTLGQQPNNVFYIIPISGEYYMQRHRVKMETVGQYTGLKDIDGMEIYEGDVVEVSGAYRSLIKFHDGAFYHYDIANISRRLSVTTIKLNIIKVIGKK